MVRRGLRHLSDQGALPLDAAEREAVLLAASEPSDGDRAPAGKAQWGNTEAFVEFFSGWRSEKAATALVEAWAGAQTGGRDQGWLRFLRDHRTTDSSALSALAPRLLAHYRSDGTALLHDNCVPFWTAQHHRPNFAS